jgi:hypothetical protein
MSEDTEQQDFTSDTEVSEDNLLLSNSTFLRSLYMKKKNNKTVKMIGEIVIKNTQVQENLVNVIQSVNNS